MKIVNRIILLTSLSVLTACGSNRPMVTGTEGGSPSATADGTPSGQAALYDSDGDTVPDVRDNCANTPSRALVDAMGCEVPTGPVEGLVFGTNETILPDSAKPVLDVYVNALKRNPELSVAVEAHTDNRGPAAVNRDLSKERVLSVVRYMVVNGVNPDRIKPYGWGESRPLFANATEEGRAQNRRIEIRVLEEAL